ncbi:MAG: hypothetical protein PVH68_15445 [Armatimonadota bacterium]
MDRERVWTMRWERVPILGKNPVFCFEVRWLWRRGPVIAALGLLTLHTTFGFWWFQATIASVFGPASDWFGMWGDVWTKLAWLTCDPPPPRLFEDFPGHDVSVLGSDHLHRAYVAMLWLSFLAKGTARFCVPGIAAASTATDHMGRRLEPLVASRMTLGEILLGKAAALILIFAPLPFLVIVPVGPLARVSPLCVLLPVLTVLELLLALSAGALIGVRVGLSPRGGLPAAIAGSIVVAAVALPIAAGGLGTILALLLLQLCGRLGVAGIPGWLSMAAAQVAIYAVAVAFFWITAGHALDRVAE